MTKLIDSQIPNWYWTRGLHDAQIKSCKVIELNYDYRAKRPRRNYLELILDSEHALMENDIASIKFYNFKCNDLKEIENSWWIDDVLEYSNDKYILRVHLRTLNKELNVLITFDDAELKRIK